MKKDNGDTEVAFIFALILWCTTGTVAWLASVFYTAWQNNEIIEFSARGFRIFDLFPMSIKFGLVAFAAGILAYYSLRQSLKFVYLFRTNETEY